MISQDFTKRAQVILAPYLGENITCASLYVGRLGGSPAHEYHVGNRDFFDLASLTKALVTAPIAHEYFDLAQTVGSIDPSLPLVLHSIKIEDLLRHRSGLTWWSNFWVQRNPFPLSLSWQERYEQVVAHVEEVIRYQKNPSPPRYSDVGYILLGSLLEKASQTDLQTLLSKRLPEGAELSYRPKEAAVPTAYCPIEKKRLSGEPHDENARALGGVAGHAGLFGTAAGVWEWLSELCEPSSKLRTSDFAGWQKASDFVSAADFGDSDTVGHLGFTGTSFWVSPKTLKAVVFLSNRIYGQRQSPWMTGVRTQISQLAQEAVEYC